MITLKDASKIAYIEFDKIYNLVAEKYESIDYDNSKNTEEFYVKCKLHKSPENQIIDVMIRFIPDYQKRNPKIPKNINEYYDQGGGKELEKKILNSNKEAWKCQVISSLINGKKLEYGVSINEKNFSNESINEIFSSYIVK